MKAIRRSYVVIKRKYKKIGKKNVRLTQSTLLLLQAIVAASSRYTFPVLDTEAPLPAEKRLNINDEFISYDIAYYLRGEMIDEGGGTAGTHYHSYAPMELDVAFTPLTGAWDGILTIAVNKISRLENWDLKKHNYVTRTQWANLALNAAAEVVQLPTQPNSDFSHDANIPMQPMLTLSGAKKNTIEINLDAAIPATVTAAWTTVGVAPNNVITVSATELALFFRGMLAQNAAVFQK